MFDWWGGPIPIPPYHPNMYSIALLTTPVLLVGVLVPGTTLFSPWASLYAWVRGLMDLGVPPKFELRFATLVSKVGVPTAILVFRESKTDSSLHGATPTIMEPPSIPAFLPSAFVACNLVWNLMCIQLEFGGITCCRTVPQAPNCWRMKLAADGGNPQTVTQVAKGAAQRSPPSPS